MRGDDELLNLLILELFDDFSSKNESKPQKSLIKQSSFTFTNESSNATQSSFTLKTRQNISVNTAYSNKSSHSTIKSSRSRKSDTTIAMHNTKPTLIDTYYDLLKSLHLHVTIKPMRIYLKKTQLDNKSENTISLCLPKVNLNFGFLKYFSL